MQCNFCKGPAHPATGCVYGPKTIACASCVRDFWKWARGHTNKKAARRKRKDGTMKSETSLSFYEAAGKKP